MDAKVTLPSSGLSAAPAPTGRKGSDPHRAVAMYDHLGSHRAADPKAPHNLFRGSCQGENQGFFATLSDESQVPFIRPCRVGCKADYRKPDLPYMWGLRKRCADRVLVKIPRFVR